MSQVESDIEKLRETLTRTHSRRQRKDREPHSTHIH